MKRNEQIVPGVRLEEDGEGFVTYDWALPFRMSAALAARSLMGISAALHRIADTLELQRREDKP